MNRDEIAAAALELFRARGYDAVTVQDICDACSISKPTFYSRVSSKDDLIVDFYDSVTLELTRRLSSLVSAKSRWEQLMVCFGTLVDETERIGPEIMRQMLIINLREDRHSFDERKYLTNVMVAIIKNGQEEGEIGNTMDAEGLYHTATYLFQGYLSMWCIRRGEMDWRDELERGLRALFIVRAPQD